MKATNKISVLIVNYNGERFIADCLSSVLKSKYSNFEVIYLENGSTDNSFRIARSFKSNRRLKLFKSSKNLFFAGGYNFAASKATGDIVICLNSDTEVDPLWLLEIAKFMKGHPKYVVQPKILNHPDTSTINTVGGIYNVWGFGKGKGFTEIDNHQYDKELNIDFALGTALVMHRKFFIRLGGFDEWYKYHYEDVDLCLRAKKNGGKCFLCPTSIIYHKMSLTVKKHVFKPDLIFNIRKNRLRTVLKNYSGVTLLFRLTTVMLTYLALVVGDLLHMRLKYIRLTIMAVVAALRYEN